jgi:galactokinase
VAFHQHRSTKKTKKRATVLKIALAIARPPGTVNLIGGHRWCGRLGGDSSA